MHIEDITAALASRDIATIKEAFLALANYPKQDRIAGPSAGNAMIFVQAAAEALSLDYSIMPVTRARRSGSLGEHPTRMARLLFSATGKHGPRGLLKRAGFIQPCQPYLADLPPAGPDWQHEMRARPLLN
jgi:hypothetical protein